MYRVTTVFSGPLVVGGGINQFYFDEAGGSAAAAHAAARAFWTAANDVMSTQVSWTTEGEVEIVSETGAITGVESTDPFTSNGSATGDPLPVATQGLIRWRTGVFLGGRELRGRTFIPGVTEGLNGTDGRPNSGALIEMNQAVTAMLGAASSEFRIFSRTKNASATVVSGSAWTQWATLRSRRD
jgi:hypothetical protein